MGARATKLFHANVFAGHGLDDVWAGDKHVRGLVDHDHEVGQRWGVNRSTCSRTHDD